MNIDFFYALLTGWSLLGFFWLFTIFFIFIRKPPKSRLTFKLTILSITIFVTGYLILYLFK